MPAGIPLIYEPLLSARQLVMESYFITCFQVTNLCKWSSLLQWFMKICVFSGMIFYKIADWFIKETGKSEANVAEKCFLNGWLIYQEADKTVVTIAEKSLLVVLGLWRRNFMLQRPS